MWSLNLRRLIRLATSLDRALYDLHHCLPNKVLPIHSHCPSTRYLPGQGISFLSNILLFILIQNIRLHATIDQRRLVFLLVFISLSGATKASQPLSSLVQTDMGSFLVNRDGDQLCNKNKSRRNQAFLDFCLTPPLFWLFNYW